MNAADLNVNTYFDRHSQGVYWGGLLKEGVALLVIV